MRNGFNILFSSFFVNRSLCSCEIWTGLVESSVIYLKKKIPLTGKQNSIFNIKKTLAEKVIKDAGKKIDESSWELYNTLDV